MKNKGFIGLILLIIIGLALLKYYFNWSIFEAAATPEGKGTVSYIGQVLSTIWSYLALPAKFIWNQVIWPLLSMIVNNASKK